MKETTLKIIYSKNLERRRILDVTSKLQWYKNKGYTVYLPNNNLQYEYENEEYQKIQRILIKEWNKIIPLITKKFHIIGLKISPKYIIQLTKYGTGGSYHLPNRIILNFKNKQVSFLTQTIIHEIIHLCVESLIQKHKIDHWGKERIVDLLSKKILGKKYNLQILDKETIIKVDKVFKKYFPDIPKIIQGSSSNRSSRNSK